MDNTPLLIDLQNPVHPTIDAKTPYGSLAFFTQPGVGHHAHPGLIPGLSRAMGMPSEEFFRQFGSVVEGGLAPGAPLRVV